MSKSNDAVLRRAKLKDVLAAITLAVPKAYREMADALGTRHCPDFMHVRLPHENVDAAIAVAGQLGAQARIEPGTYPYSPAMLIVWFREATAIPVKG